jgi:hypothetical protein
VKAITTYGERSLVGGVFSLMAASARNRTRRFCIDLSLARDGEARIISAFASSGVNLWSSGQEMATPTRSRPSCKLNLNLP